MEKRTEYRLKLAGNYLYFQEHGDGTEILSSSCYREGSRPAIFNTMWGLITMGKITKEEYHG